MIGSFACMRCMYPWSVEATTELAVLHSREVNRDGILSERLARDLGHTSSQRGRASVLADRT